MFGLYLNKDRENEPWPVTVNSFIKHALAWHHIWLLQHIVGWQPQGIPHVLAPADWPPPPPWTLEVCPRCDVEVERGTVKVITVYREDKGHWCKARVRMCAWCRDGIGELDEWPLRGEDGRFLAAAECGEEPAP
jgi:hypothetical protein